MDGHRFSLGETELIALPVGALYAPAAEALVVSDLHLGKAERMARREGVLAPPYEIEDTLTRLSDAIDAAKPRLVICLGDSFDDDLVAIALPDTARASLSHMMAGRRWIWIAGNHDPAPPDLGGACLAEHRIGALVFRHIAEPTATGEVSGHYHPKVRLRGRRRCFLVDRNRAILPSFGAYTGGLDIVHPVYDALFEHDAMALITGAKITPAPRAALIARAPADRNRYGLTG